MTHSSVAKLIKISKALLDQTKRGRLTWVQTENPDIFEVSFPDYSIRIADKRGWRHAPDNEPYEVKIYNNEGRVIETATSYEMATETFPEEESGLSIVELLADLHDLARRQALGTDRALDDLLSKLSSV